MKNSNEMSLEKGILDASRPDEIKRFESQISKEEKKRIKVAVQELSELEPIKAFISIFFLWACVFLVVFMAIKVSNIFATILAIFLVGSRQHALLIMMHDAAHFRFVKNVKINDIISDFFCAFPHFITTLKYRGSHLKHHRYLNTDKDPDWQIKKGKKEWEFPKTRKEIFVMLFYRLVGYGGYEFIMLLRRFGVNNEAAKDFKASKGEVIFRITYYIVLVSILTYFGWWKYFLIYWIIPLLTVLPFLLRLRSIAEHFGLERTNELNSSRNVKVNIFEQIFLVSRSIYYHLDHHLYPGVPFYNLKKLHKVLMKNPKYAAEAVNSKGYLRTNSTSVLSDISISPKE